MPLILGSGGRLAGADAQRRATPTCSIATPFNIAGFNWRNTIKVFDQVDARAARHQRSRCPTSRRPTRTTRLGITTVRGGDFYSDIDWETGIDLQTLFQSTWKLTPTVGVTNITAGPLLVRTPGTQRRVGAQGKKLQFALQSIPVFYGFLNKGCRAGGAYALQVRANLSTCSIRRPATLSAGVHRRRSPGPASRGFGAKTPATTLASFSLYAEPRGEAEAVGRRLGRRPTRPGSCRRLDPPERQPVSVLSLTTSSVGLRLRAGQGARPDWLGHAGADEFAAESARAGLPALPDARPLEGTGGLRHGEVRAVPLERAEPTCRCRRRPSGRSARCSASPRRGAAAEQRAAPR